MRFWLVAQVQRPQRLRAGGVTRWAELKKQVAKVLDDGSCVLSDGELIPAEALKATPRPDVLYVKPL